MTIQTFMSDHKTPLFAALTIFVMVVGFFATPLSGFAALQTESEYTQLEDGSGWSDDSNTTTSNTSNTTTTTNTQSLFSGFFSTSPTVTPVPNPSRPQSCGLDVALVIDNSGSINSTELSQMKTAFNGFVDAFEGTQTELAVVSFNTTAQVRQGFTDTEGTLHSVINGVPNTSNLTNWKDALLKARSLFPHRSNPDVIVFTSDGNPTTGGGSYFNVSGHLDTAILEANAAKEAGVHIITLGIGDNLNTTNLGYLSSPDQAITSNFNTLANDLADLADELCEPEPAPVCTLDVTQDDLTWTTDHATVVDIEPLTNSPQIPKTGSSGGSSSVIFSGDFHKDFRLPNEYLIQQDIYNSGGSFTLKKSTGFYADQATANRLCSLLDPNANVQATYYRSDKYSSPEDNQVARFENGIWKRYPAKYYNKHFRWQFTCTASTDSARFYPLDGVHTFVPPLDVGTHTYKLTADGPGGTNMCTDTVTIDPEIVPPTVELTADPEVITKGDSSTLTWTSQNATSCSSDDFNTSGATAGSLAVSPVDTTTYTIDCVGPGGTATDDAIVTVKEPEVKGSIKVCKLIVDKDDTLVDGSENAGAFSIEVAGVTVDFTTPLSFTHDLINDYHDYKDAECVVYDDLSLGTYTYGEEQIIGNNWQTPLYNDGFTAQVSDLNDFLPFQPTGSNDADGEIVLTKSRPHRTLSVLNTYVKDDRTPPEVPSCAFAEKDRRTIVNFNTNEKLRSDASGYEAFGDAVWTDIPAGTYTVSLMAWDGYLGRENHSQPHEQYQLQLKNGHALVAVTSTHHDLADNVVQASVAEVVDQELVLGEKITKIVPFHAFYPDTANPNSVVPICAAFDKVEEPEAPTCTATVAPGEITEGGEAILSWTSADADSASFDQNIGNVDLNGSITVSPSDDITYTGTFIGEGGTTTCEATLEVEEETEEPQSPICVLSANPKSFPYGGGKTTISWTTTNADEGDIVDNVGDPDEKDLDPIGSGSFEVQVDTTTVFTADVEGPGGTASCAVTVKVDKQSCANCGGGAGVPFDPNTSLTHRDFPNPQPLTGQVYLSQVPYTGFTTGPIGAALFWVAIFLMSAMLSYFVVQKQLIGRALAFVSAGASASAYTHYSAYDDEEEIIDEPITTTPQATQYSLSQHGAGIGGLGGNADIAQQLEERAHKENILISSEGLSTIISQSAGVDSQAISLLDQVIEKAKELYPREDGWILLNSERVQTILSQLGGGSATAAPATPAYEPPVQPQTQQTQAPAEPVSAYEPAAYTPPAPSAAPTFGGDVPQTDTQPSSSAPYTAPEPARAPAYDPAPATSFASHTTPEAVNEARDIPTFIEYLVTGREHEAFTFLRSLSAEGRNERDFLTQVVVALDGVYKYRIEGGNRPDAAVLAKLDSIGTQTLERMLEILADSVDHSYSSSKLGAKMAVTKVFELLTGKL